MKKNYLGRFEHVEGIGFRLEPQNILFIRLRKF